MKIKRKKMIKIKTIPGSLSFPEAQKELLHLAKLISEIDPADYEDKGDFVLATNIQLESIEAISKLIREYMRQVMLEIIYQRFGKKYRKIDKDEVIKTGAMQSWYGGELKPVMNSDGKTVGNKPSSFSDERDFYNPLEEDEERV